MSYINSLPAAIVKELEKAGIPIDSLIFYQNDGWVYQRGSTVSRGDQLESSPIASLGPFGKSSKNNHWMIKNQIWSLDIYPVNVSFILYPERSEYTITKIGNQELNEDQRATGIFAPISRITLQGFAREIAKIPDDATHFCWLYQPNNIRIDNDTNWGNSYELNLLKLGGFAYFRQNSNDLNSVQLLRVNSLDVSANNGLVFEGPFSWRSEFTEQMWSQKRFQVNFS